MNATQAPINLDKAIVSQITLPETYPARRAVLFPNGPESNIHIPNDEQGVHFGAFRGEELIAVISLFREPGPTAVTSLYGRSKSLRFRKFACLVSHQSRGIGTQLFQHVLDYARTHPQLGLGTVVWCDARWSTREWYLKRGMKVVGQRFFKGVIEHIVMVIQV